MANEATKLFSDLSDKAAAVNEIIGVLNTEIATHIRTQPGVAMEAMFVRDDLRAAAGSQPVEGELTPQSIWSQEPRFSAMESLPRRNIAARSRVQGGQPTLA